MQFFSQRQRLSFAPFALFIATLLLWLVLAVSTGYAAPISVIDDRQNTVTLPQPAQRIISLAPSSTELIYSAGAGDKLVAAVSFSNYPEAAKKLPLVGSYNQFDLERVLAYQPDLVISWYSGNQPEAIEQLEKLGIAVYRTETRYLEQLPETLIKIGQLAGTETVAQQEADRFKQTLQHLKQAYSTQAKVRVFYQVWNQPLITINQENLISQVIEVCGGQNVFAELESIAPKIDVEAVLKANPDAIVASGMDEQRPEWLNDWKAWPSLKAVQDQQLHFIPPDHIQRQTVRVLLGAERLCQQLDQTRQLNTQSQRKPEQQAKHESHKDDALS